jgi:hypothetical protein
MVLGYAMERGKEARRCLFPLCGPLRIVRIAVLKLMSES